MTSPVEPPLRTCRTCGNVERNIHYRCTNCGRDYAADPPRFSKRQKVTAAGVERLRRALPKAEIVH